MDTPENIKPDEDEISLIDLLAVLIKHRWLIIITTVLSAVAVLAFSIGSLMLPNEKSYYPNYYTAKSTLSINSDTSGGLSMDSEISGLAALAGISTGSGPNIAAIANKYMLSDSFLDVLIKELNLLEVYKLDDSKYPKTDSRNFVRENLSLNEDSSSSTIEILYKDIDRELATQIVNKVAVMLEKTFQDTSSTETSIKKGLLEESIAVVKDNINSIFNNFEDIQVKYGIYDIDLFIENHSINILEIQSELLTKDMDIDIYKTSFNIEDPIFAKLKQERNSLQAGINKLKDGYTIGNTIVPSEQEMPELVRKFKEISLELELKKKIYLTLVQEYELVKLNASSTPPTFIVYEKAEVPEMKSGPSRGKLCIIVTMAMFFLSVFMAFIVEFIGNIRKDSTEMDKLRIGLKSKRRNKQ